MPSILKEWTLSVLSDMNKRELRKWRESYSDWDQGCLAEGLRLNVHFDEKDHLKRIGARWQPDPSGKGGYWWISGAKLNNDMVTAVPMQMPVIVNVFELTDSDSIAIQDNHYSGPTATGTLLEWLNKNKMIAGNHGELNKSRVQQEIDNRCLVPTEYILKDESADISVEFRFYTELNVVYVGNHYATLESGREMWDALVESGYIPLTSATAEV